MPLALRRALSPERMTEPKPEGPLRLASLTRRRDGLGEGGGVILALENRLPGNPDRRRRFTDGASFLKFPEDQSAAPIEFHGRETIRNTAGRPSRTAGRGERDNLGFSNRRHELVKVSTFSQVVDSSERNLRRSLKKDQNQQNLSKVPSLSAFTGYPDRIQKRPKALILRPLRVVAGVGFEPTTFRL